MHAAQAALDVSANNIANLGTQGFKRQQLLQQSQPEGGVSTSITQTSIPGNAPDVDLVDQLQAKNAFLANLRVFETSSQMTGTLVDQKV